MWFLGTKCLTKGVEKRLPAFEVVSLALLLQVPLHATKPNPQFGQPVQNVKFVVVKQSLSVDKETKVKEDKVDPPAFVGRVVYPENNLLECDGAKVEIYVVVQPPSYRGPKGLDQ